MKITKFDSLPYLGHGLRLRFRRCGSDIIGRFWVSFCKGKSVFETRRVWNHKFTATKRTDFAVLQAGILIAWLKHDNIEIEFLPNSKVEIRQVGPHQHRRWLNARIAGVCRAGPAIAERHQLRGGRRCGLDCGQLRQQLIHGDDYQPAFQRRCRQGH